MHDIVAPYLFEHAPIRVQAVRLTTAWQALHAAHKLPERVTHILGRCTAATSLLATSIKFDGRISVQLQSQGALRLLLCQATHDLGLRGMAQLAQKVDLPAHTQTDGIADLTDGGNIAVTIENMQDDKRYQGITPIVGDSLASSFEHYFAQSEQLPTRLWLAADGETAAGLMLQRMPGPVNEAGPDADEAWRRAQQLAQTVTDAELLGLAPQELVHRLFHEEDLRQLEPRPLRFHCNCSQQRVGTMLTSLGQGEVDSIIAEQGRVEVTCEFCGRDYRFDAVDVAALFTDAAPGEGSGLLQ